MTAIIINWLLGLSVTAKIISALVVALLAVLGKNWVGRKFIGDRKQRRINELESEAEIRKVTDKMRNADPQYFHIDRVYANAKRNSDSGGADL